MKRVPFKVAKAIKDAGYPQQYYGHHYLVNGEPSYGALTEEDIASPTYLELWLWLWREKDIQILNDDIGSANILPFCIEISEYEDPEKAIIAAIECLVDNDLIK